MDGGDPVLIGHIDALPTRHQLVAYCLTPLGPVNLLAAVHGWRGSFFLIGHIDALPTRHQVVVNYLPHMVL
jgi:hypothetical protein